MSPDDSAGARRLASSRWLEHVTGLVLVLVPAALGWIVLAAYRPDWEWAASEVQIVLVLALLTAALGLVSVVALSTVPPSMPEPLPEAGPPTK
jgi:hypothetical protein